jgi:hypothetical protein
MANFLFISDTYPPFSDCLGIGPTEIFDFYLFETPRLFDPSAISAHFREDIQTTLNTAFLLTAQYNGKAIIPLADVCRDYFSHLTPEKLMRKVMAGQIWLPIVHIERSQKSAKGVHLQDLADYLDKRRQ